MARTAATTTYTKKKTPLMATSRKKRAGTKKAKAKVGTKTLTVKRRGPGRPKKSAI